ncbi:MAG: 3,4-dihydroxy-2-butanone-4-phosphate synthase [Myxococcota bacterium]|nr:3,4-dihydroxy-2-butanone-4-phosphate synthase [Myxococcota bacterium]
MIDSNDGSIQRVEAAIEAIRNGEMVILVDDEDRENEGDLVMAGSLVTPAAINFMARFGRGLICLAMSSERCDQLSLPLMVRQNHSGFGTAFTVSIEAAEGVTTGISAADRAHTIRTAVRVDAKPSDLVSPGHIFPLRAREGGVLVRTGQTEGSVDLARLAGLEPAGVICEIMNDDGTMARRPELEIFAEEHGLLLISVADIIRYRLLRERMVRREAEVDVEIDGIGRFRAISYSTLVDDHEHLALVKGEPSPDQPVLGRVHQEEVISDVFRADGAESRWKLEYALRQMETEGCGVLVYLQKAKPRLKNSLLRLGGSSEKNGERSSTVNSSSERAASAEERGAIGLPPDLRELGIGAQILLDQGVRRLRVMSGASSRARGVEGYGIELVEQLVIPPRASADSSPHTPSQNGASDASR